MECYFCKWYAQFEGVCCNGNSEHRARVKECGKIKSEVQDEI